MHVTIRLTGGTGNQLFGYAIGRAIESRGHGVDFFIEDFKLETMRCFMLDKLGLDLKIAPRRQGKEIYEMPDRAGFFNSFFLWPIQDCTLIGYFQSEQYFKDIQDQIRQEVMLGLKGRLVYGAVNSQKTLRLASRIQAGPSCFIHVRRSDYLKNAWLHDSISKDYYQQAIDRVMMDCSSIVHFYIFSDDPDWCREHFTWDNMTVVGNKMSATVDQNNEIHLAEGGQEAEDLYLMSLCDYAIVANSSFSWWGAWLGRKKVYAPKDWFKPGSGVCGDDVVPDWWTKL